VGRKVNVDKKVNVDRRTFYFKNVFLKNFSCVCMGYKIKLTVIRHDSQYRTDETTNATNGTIKLCAKKPI